MIIVVRLGQLAFVHKQIFKPAAPAQLKIIIHLDRFEWANLDTNLAAHADRDVDVEHPRIKLRFAHVVGLFVLALGDVDALRGTFLLTNLAGDAPQPGFRIRAVVNQKRKIPIVLRQRTTFFRILDGD